MRRRSVHCSVRCSRCGPDASTAGLTHAEAHRKVGATSLAQTQWITIAVVLALVLGGGVCLVAGAILLLLAQ